MRAAAFQFEDRCIISRRLIDLAGMLRNELSHHFQVAELFEGDILQHVANRRILHVEGLHPV